MGIPAMTKAIFLDRDGVLNQAVIKNGKPFAPSCLSEVIIPPEAKNALMALKAADFLLIGVTNQPDVVRGTTSLKTVEAINEFLITELKLNDMRVCYHDDVARCSCRKPRPGLLLQAAKDYKIILHESFMIGDRWKDIEAGINAKCKTIWIKNSYKEKIPQRPDFTAHSLKEAADWILSIGTHHVNTLGFKH